MQWSALEKADPTDPTVLAKHLEALENLDPEANHMATVVREIH